MAAKLLDFVVNKSGPWAAASANTSGQILELKSMDDAVSMQGPVSLNISLISNDRLTPVAGGGDGRAVVNELFNYNLDIPAGYLWKYSLANYGAVAEKLPSFSAIIRQTSCRPKTPVQSPDLPCDFAVGNRPCVGEFFPVGCEPCGDGPVRMPPTCGPSLAVTPATGGCTRPRFFNGMFITREDLETELRYLRLKNKLQRRADGQGVVWGLGVGLAGGSVCVQPGYGVDCCGNDLTVTSIYKVDQAVLLSDPAICNLLTGRPQRMSLLLEYVECPEEPRPVHGDKCYGGTTACEMSRVRETVRLRLVPTREYKPAGPIQAFLNAIAPASVSNSPTNTPAPASSTGGGSSSPASVSTMPFTISFNLIGSNNTTTATTTLTPMSSFSHTATLAISTLPANIMFVLTPAVSGFTFTQGSVIVTESGGGTSTVQYNNDNTVQWKTADSAVNDPLTTTAVWTGSQLSNGGSLSTNGTTTITMNLIQDSNGTNARYALNFTGQTQASATLTTQTATTPFPCLTDPCCPSGKKKLFSVMPPWADQNPFSPGQAADPKVITLAIAYALWTGMSQQAGPTATSTKEMELIYLAAVKWLDPGLASVAELEKITLAVQQLLEDWCCAALYPGPICNEEPDGVVIGCALVSSGRIERVSPWSGRRMVVHYPLLSYWGAEFGLLPLDVIASKIFPIICCLSSLKAPFREPSSNEPNEYSLSIGSGTLGLTSLKTLDLVRAMPSSQVRSESVGLTTFAMNAISALAQPQAPVGTPIVDYTIANFPSVHLVMPDPTAGASSTQSTAGASTGVVTLVQNTLSTATARAAVPPLLRDFAQTVSANLASALPVSTLNPAQVIATPLTSAGVTTIGAVLSRTPESLYSDVLNSTQPAAVSDLVKNAESKTTDVTNAVIEALKATAASQNVISTDGLATPAAQSILVNTLAPLVPLPVGDIQKAITASLP